MNDYTDPIGHDEIANGPHPHDPPRSRRGAAVGLLTVGGLAAAGAALYVSNSAGAAPSSSSTSAPSTSSSAAAGASSSATCPAPGQGTGPKGGPGAGAGRLGGAGGPGGPGGSGADGLISSISSASLTVRDLFAISHTYKITSTTTIHSGPTGSVKLSALTRGEHVVVRTAASTATAADIDVHPATIDGAVTSITGSAITVTDRDGFTRTIDTDAQTKYTVDAVSAARSKIKTGSVVHAQGTVDANGTALDAARVDVRTAAPAKPAGAARCVPVGPHGAGQHGRPGAPAPTGSGTGARPTQPAPTPSATTSTAPSATASR